VDLRASHSDVSTHAAKLLYEKCAEDCKSFPHNCPFSQAIFGYSDEPLLNAARQLYSIKKCDRGEEAVIDEIYMFKLACKHTHDCARARAFFDRIPMQPRNHVLGIDVCLHNVHMARLTR
jgi:hypothetical protein